MRITQKLHLKFKHLHQTQQSQCFALKKKRSPALPPPLFWGIKTPFSAALSIAFTTDDRPTLLRRSRAMLKRSKAAELELLLSCNVARWPQTHLCVFFLDMFIFVSRFIKGLFVWFCFFEVSCVAWVCFNQNWCFFVFLVVLVCSYSHDVLGRSFGERVASNHFADIWSGFLDRGRASVVSTRNEDTIGFQAKSRMAAKPSLSNLLLNLGCA